MAQNQIFRGTARRIETQPETGTRNYFYRSTPEKRNGMLAGKVKNWNFKMVCFWSKQA